MNATTTLAKGVVRALAAGMAVCLLSWLLVECAPGSSAERAAIASGAISPGDLETTSEVRALLVSQVAEELDLESSPLARLPRRVVLSLTLDFGPSWRDGTPVSDRILSRAGATTLLLSFFALMLASAFACLAAPSSARGGRGHGFGAVLAALVLSVPIPWLAMLALDVLSYGHPLAIAPKGGMDSPLSGILPVLVLAAAPTAVLWRHLRQRLLDESEAQWVVAARARGTTESKLWNRQLLRVALPTMIALMPLMLAYLLAASVVVERVFAIDGLGALVARAASVGDAPVLIAFASLSAMLISAATQCANGLARRMDPRREAGQ